VISPTGSQKLVNVSLQRETPSCVMTHAREQIRTSVEDLRQ